MPALIHRCIMIFPKFENMHLIDGIRRRYDPLYHHVHPHVTLIFPFMSSLTKEQVEAHMNVALKQIKPFILKLQGISGEQGGYLFLNVVKGREELIDIHRRLYQGILKPYYPKFLNNKKYLPHMTVGRITNEQEMTEAVKKYKTMNEVFEEVVMEISVEIIDEFNNSHLEMSIGLK